MFEVKTDEKIKQGRAGVNKQKIYDWFDKQTEPKTFLEISLETGFSLPTVKKYYHMYKRERGSNEKYNQYY